MKMTMVLFILGVCFVFAAGFFFYQRSQLATEFSAIEADRYVAEQEMNQEIDQLGQANEDTRWRWLELGNDAARAEFSMQKNGVASIGCLVVGVVAGSVGFVRMKRKPASTPQG